jgi:hypothetical protein
LLSASYEAKAKSFFTYVHSGQAAGGGAIQQSPREAKPSFHLQRGTSNPSQSSQAGPQGATRPENQSRGIALFAPSCPAPLASFFNPATTALGSHLRPHPTSSYA